MSASTVDLAEYAREQARGRELCETAVAVIVRARHERREERNERLGLVEVTR